MKKPFRLNPYFAVGQVIGCLGVYLLGYGDPTATAYFLTNAALLIGFSLLSPGE